MVSDGAGNPSRGNEGFDGQNELVAIRDRDAGGSISKATCLRYGGGLGDGEGR